MIAGLKLFLTAVLQSALWEKNMNKVDVYNSDYTKLNHSYIVMYETYEKLIQCEDADEEVLVVLENILRALNPALDLIKSQMTVKTRYKDEGNTSAADGKNESGKNSGTGNGPVILHGKFGDD